MRTTKIMLFAIFVLLLSDKVAGLSFTLGLNTITKALGIIGSTIIAIWALEQGEKEGTNGRKT